jgi:hypothetical protein
MVGTSAIRSPAARHCMKARRNADTVRTTRMAMGTDFVWLGLATPRANYQSRGGEATCRPGAVALRLGHDGAGIAPEAGYGHLMGGGVAAC